MPKQRKVNRQHRKPQGSGRKQLHSLVATAAPKDGWFRVVSHKGTDIFSEYVGNDFNEARKIAEKVAITGITCYIHNYHNRVIYTVR
jgi:hypothetical protein